MTEENASDFFHMLKRSVFYTLCAGALLDRFAPIPEICDLNLLQIVPIRIIYNKIVSAFMVSNCL